MSDFKSCPFCGGTNIQPSTQVMHQVMCDDCRAVVCSLVSRDDAREKWNRRYPQVFCDCGDSLTQGDAVCGTCHDVEVMTARNE